MDQRRRVVVYIEADDWARYQGMAKACGLSLSAFVREALPPGAQQLVLSYARRAASRRVLSPPSSAASAQSPEPFLEARLAAYLDTLAEHNP